MAMKSRSERDPSQALVSVDHQQTPALLLLSLSTLPEPLQAPDEGV
jgi:hypothetical protein